MKKQDNESLIQEIQKRLDWYTMEASDEEFDADEAVSYTHLVWRTGNLKDNETEIWDKLSGQCFQL